jgi:hypothetical protein
LAEKSNLVLRGLFVRVFIVDVPSTSFPGRGYEIPIVFAGRKKYGSPSDQVRQPGPGLPTNCGRCRPRNSIIAFTGEKNQSVRHICARKVV